MNFCDIVIISPWKIIYLPIDTTNMLRHLMSPLRIFKQATIHADTRWTSIYCCQGEILSPLILYFRRQQYVPKCAPHCKTFLGDYTTQLRQPIETSLVLCHLKTLRLYTGVFKFQLDHYLTNVARAKSTHWG